MRPCELRVQKVRRPGEQVLRLAGHGLEVGVPRARGVPPPRRHEQEEHCLLVDLQRGPAGLRLRPHDILADRLQPPPEPALHHAPPVQHAALRHTHQRLARRPRIRREHGVPPGGAPRPRAAHIQVPRQEPRARRGLGLQPRLHPPERPGPARAALAPGPAPAGATPGGLPAPEGAPAPAPARPPRALRPGRPRRGRHGAPPPPPPPPPPRALLDEGHPGPAT